jgi:hypothetical protein
MFSAWKPPFRSIKSRADRILMEAPPVANACGFLFCTAAFWNAPFLE